MGSIAPRGLGNRGKALWRRLDVELDSLEGSLAHEACRAVDRLHSLHAIADADHSELLRGATMRVRDVIDTDSDREVSVEITVDKLLGEIRAQQANLKVLILAVVGLKNYEPAVPEPKTPGGGRPSAETTSTVDEFTQRRAQRGSSA